MAAELACIDLHAGYGRRDVIRAVSATLQPGTVTALLGANGAGKTTLLRLLCGYLRPRKGKVLHDGVELSRLSPRERARRIAMVPQVAPEALPLTVHEAVAIARYPHSQARSGQHEPYNGQVAVDSSLRQMDLTGLAERPCFTLSGGEWRRLLIAQGLAQLSPDPGVLLLDEPTAFLDPPTRRHILKRINELAAGHGMTALVVLHDVALAKEFTKQALLLHDGRILAAGAPGAVLTTANLARMYECTPEQLGMAEVSS